MITNDAYKIKVGSSEAARVYKGSNLIWDSGNSHVYVSGTTRVSGQGGTLPSFGSSSDIKTFSLIGDTITNLPDNALFACGGLTTANLGSSITGIGERVFYGCSSLTSVTIPPTVKLIDDEAFANCSNITGYQIPDSVTGVGDNVFSNNNSLTEIRFGTGLYSVGTQAARSVGTLTGLYFAQSGTYGGLNRIAPRAFEFCTGLESIRVPSGITLLDDSCFKGCSNLKVIRIMSENPPTFDSTFTPFANTDSSAKIYVKLADSGNWSSTFAGLDVEPIIVQDTFQLTLSEVPSTTDTFTFTFNQIASGSLGYKWESDGGSNSYTCEKQLASVAGTTGNTWRIEQSSYLNPIYLVDPRSSSANAGTPFDVGSDWIKGQEDGAGGVTYLESGLSLNFQNVAYSDSIATGILTN